MAISAPASQKFVPIRDIRDDIVILDDGSLRAVLMTSSINFSLKSQEEQESILYQFQNFLNTLDFQTQINIRSRALDIEPYIQLLQKQYKNQVNELMKVQIREYIEFIREFTENTNIMNKRFYVVVPYTPAFAGSQTGFLQKIKETLGFGSSNQKEADNETFEQNKYQLEERISIVEEGLASTGVRSARLGDQELIELFHQSFNPGETDTPGQSSSS